MTHNGVDSMSKWIDIGIMDESGNPDEIPRDLNSAACVTSVSCFFGNALEAGTRNQEPDINKRLILNPNFFFYLLTHYHYI